MINPTVDPDRLSTGVLSLDVRLGGQLPPGALVEVYGAKSSGRSALGLSCLAWCQKASHEAALIDASGSFDLHRTESFGINPTDLWYKMPEHLEDTLTAAKNAAVAGCRVVVVDCLASMPGKDEDMESSSYRNRRTISDKLRSLAFEVSETKATVIIINQNRIAIGAVRNVSKSYFGDLVRMYCRRKVQLIEGPPAYDHHLKVGQYVYAKVSKVLGLAPYNRTMIRMDDHGLDYVGDIVDLGLQLQLLERRGPYVVYPGAQEHNLGRSYNEILSSLRDKPEVWSLLEKHVRRKMLGV